uniref:Uncharacterized protein n=1 Tax=Zea mays TaxID=4577 RepID=A0A804NC43_MAIZE
MVGKDHPVPAISKSEFTVICDFPSEITLIANEKENRLDILEAARKADCGPDRLQASPITPVSRRGPPDGLEVGRRSTSSPCELNWDRFRFYCYWATGSHHMASTERTPPSHRHRVATQCC